MAAAAKPSAGPGPGAAALLEAHLEPSKARKERCDFLAIFWRKGDHGFWPEMLAAGEAASAWTRVVRPSGRPAVRPRKAVCFPARAGRPVSLCARRSFKIIIFV